MKSLKMQIKNETVKNDFSLYSVKGQDQDKL